MSHGADYPFTHYLYLVSLFFILSMSIVYASNIVYSVAFEVKHVNIEMYSKLKKNACLSVYHATNLLFLSIFLF